MKSVLLSLIICTYVCFRMITAVGIGELIEPGRNTLVVVSGDGWCHILLPGSAPSCPADVPQGPDNTMHVAHVQRIPPNTHVSTKKNNFHEDCAKVVNPAALRHFIAQYYSEYYIEN